MRKYSCLFFNKTKRAVSILMPWKLCFETDSWTTISRARSVNFKSQLWAVSKQRPNWKRRQTVNDGSWLLMGQNQAMVFIHHWSQSNVNTPSYIRLWNLNGSHFDLNKHTTWLISGRRKKVPYFVHCWSKKNKSWCLSTSIGPSPI